MLCAAVCSLFRIGHVRSVKLVDLIHLQSNGSVKLNSMHNIMNCRFMAGHSKWQNIKHVKATKDKEKADKCGKFAFLVRAAVREKGPDPKLNRRLADVLLDARANNVPNSTLENAMKKASSGKVKCGTLEILGPGGCYVVLEYETDNISTTRHEVKAICRKYNTSIVSGEGRWRAFYEQKGILKVSRCNDGQPLDAEKALDVAIEAGAEDVQLKTSEEDETPFLEFYCEPKDLFSVKKGVEERSYYVEEAYVGLIPHITVELSDDAMDITSNFLADLGELPEVNRIYENVQ